jgi:glycosyltransferase involved in cell wall biosynthesis
MNLVVTGLPESKTVPPRSKHVVYVGFVPADDLRALYAGANAYVSASIMEGFGLTLLESMMQGTPVVSSTAGSLPEVGGDAMIAVPDLTPEALASAIAQVVRDPVLRARMVDAGFLRLEQFRWENTASRHLALYGELLGSRPAFRDHLSMASM